MHTDQPLKQYERPVAAEAPQRVDQAHHAEVALRVGVEEVLERVREQLWAALPEGALGAADRAALDADPQA